MNPRRPINFFKLRNQRTRHGAILFIITIVLAMVSLAAYGFVAVMQTENKATHLYGDQIQTAALASSAEEYVSALLETPRSQRDAWGGIENNPALFQAIPIAIPAVGSSSQLQTTPRIGRISVISPTPAIYEAANTPQGDSQRLLRFGIVNESSKLNLATLIAWDEQFPGSARFALLNLHGMTAQLADRLLDWIDNDEIPREFGAEFNEYQQMQLRISPLNQLPNSLEELLAIPGFSMQLLWGADANRNFRIENHEQQQVISLAATPSSQQVDPMGQSRSANRTPQSFDATSTTEIPRPWSESLTLASAQRNETYHGMPRIPLNQPNLQQLHAQLALQQSGDIADFVVAYRQNGPSEKQTNSGNEVLPIDFTKQARVAINSPLDLVNAYVTIEQDDEKKQTVTSPFSFGGSGTLSSEFARFCDSTTVSPEKRHVGRININLATREVLLGIPTMTSELVDRIIEARTTNASGRFDKSTDSTILPPRSHPTWLLSEGVIDLATAKRLLPFLTCGGDIVRAQTVACFDSESPVVRSEIVVDGSRLARQSLNGFEPKSRRLYYRDLSLLGRGFSYQDLFGPPTLDGGTTATSINDLPFAASR